MEIVSSPLPALAIDVGDTSLKRDPQSARAQGAAISGAPASQVVVPPALSGDTVARTLLAALTSMASQQDSLAPLLADLTKALPLTSLPAPVRTEIARVLALAAPVSKVQPVLEESLPTPATAASTPASLTPLPRPALPALAQALEQLQASLRQWQPEAASPTAGSKPQTLLDPPAAALAMAPPPALPLLQQVARGGGLADALASLLVAQQPQVTAQEALRRQRGAGQNTLAGASADGDALLANNALAAYRKAMPTAAKAPPTSWPTEPSPAFIARTLLQRSEAALLQTRVLEVVSQGLRAEQAQPAPPNAASMHWAFDAPLTTPFGRALVRFEIDRQTPRAARERQEPVWRVRLALDVEPLGPVHAQIALQGSKAWVSLWAERSQTALLLDEQKGELRQTLVADEMDAEIVLNSAMPTPPGAGKGTIWDAST